VCGPTTMGPRRDGCGAAWLSRLSWRRYQFPIDEVRDKHPSSCHRLIQNRHLWKHPVPNSRYGEDGAGETEAAEPPEREPATCKRHTKDISNGRGEVIVSIGSRR
jgi:hypothetical protein